jgi:hypothetical protein
VASRSSPDSGEAPGLDTPRGLSVCGQVDRGSRSSGFSERPGGPNSAMTGGDSSRTCWSWPWSRCRSRCTPRLLPSGPRSVATSVEALLAMDAAALACHPGSTGALYQAGGASEDSVRMMALAPERQQSEGCPSPPHGRGVVRGSWRWPSARPLAWLRRAGPRSPTSSPAARPVSGGRN